MSFTFFLPAVLATDQWYLGHFLKMADIEKDLLQECNELEEQELTVLSDNAKADIYTKLLAIYLLQNDLVHAKFLWQRIPENVKTMSAHIESLWKIGQLLWTRKFSAVHLALNQEWPEDIRKYIEALKERLRERVKNLVSKAYSNIRTEEFASLLGMTEEKALEAAREIEWQIDSQAGFIHPVISDCCSQADTNQPISSEQQLACLTDYISYLEN